MSYIKTLLESVIGIDNVNFIGSIASIIGVIISIIIIIKVHKIQNEYLSRIRLPDIMADIKKKYKDISKYMNNIDSSINEIKKELAICNAYLNSLKAKAPKLRNNTKRLCNKINRFVSPNLFQTIMDRFIIKENSNTVIHIHNQLGAMIAEIEDYIKDQSWRIKP